MFVNDVLLKTKSISAIAAIVRRDWGIKMSSHAAPYVDAMLDLITLDDSYGLDSGYEIVARFISNAGSYRGETARLVKAELKNRMRVYERKNNLM